MTARQRFRPRLYRKVPILGYALLDRATVQDDAGRIGAFTGFTRGTKPIRANKPPDVALPFGHLVYHSIEEPLSLLFSFSGCGGCGCASGWAQKQR